METTEPWIRWAALEIIGLWADQGRPGVPPFSVDEIIEIITSQYALGRVAPCSSSPD